MKINIGSNIKRLRGEKGVTQEQLAEAMNVTCAAVSKWERSDTYPDITALQPLAYYFGVSLDELMGYDKEKVDEDIERVISEYRRTNDGKIIEEAYKNYPNDYRIMYHYIWSRGIYDAEPDLKLALAEKDEIEPICDRIIEGCADVLLCLGAWKMKAILLHAEGKTDQALAIHREKFGNWYYTYGQMNEQLFTKDRPEFLYWAKHNMYEFADVAADKLVKSYFFDTSIPYEKMVNKVEAIGDGLYKLGCEQNDAYLVTQAESLFGRLQNDLKHRVSRGGIQEDIIRITGKCLAATAKLTELSETDAALFDAVVRSHGTNDLLAYTVDCLLNGSKDPRSLALLENREYRAVIEKYRK